MLVRPYVARYGSMPIVAIGFFASTLAVLPFGAGQLGRLESANANAVWLLLYVLVVPTLLTYLLNAWALRHARSSTVAIFIYLQPIVGVALAVSVLGEPLGARALLGTAAVFAGIALVTFRPRAAAPPLEGSTVEGSTVEVSTVEGSTVEVSTVEVSTVD